MTPTLSPSTSTASPPGSLGRLEALAARLAQVQGAWTR
ncbi:nicotinate-nucleotide--dimethylbenzimidazole phosphoribosyltransferase [Hankyongella ginsenosidimutans]|nr:nicotinate-nucleotide--dimethylbenzimidazole phosphoribosyltransferase [Hankyongella ginsenosidimutans]